MAEPMMLGDVRETIGLLDLKDDLAFAYYTWACSGLPSRRDLPRQPR